MNKKIKIFHGIDTHYFFKVLVIAWHHIVTITQAIYGIRAKKAPECVFLFKY